MQISELKSCINIMIIIHNMVQVRFKWQAFSVYILTKNFWYRFSCMAIIIVDSHQKFDSLLGYFYSVTVQ